MAHARAKSNGALAEGLEALIIGRLLNRIEQHIGRLADEIERRRL
jgi:hypothetical protein